VPWAGDQAVNTWAFERFKIQSTAWNKQKMREESILKLVWELLTVKGKSKHLNMVCKKLL
jgi:uncharacterized protein YjaG (DUF416 family)